MMKGTPLKLTLAFLTFFIGVSAVSFWYLSRIEAESRQSLSDVVSAIPPVKMTVENPCDYPQPKDRELEAQEAVYLAECFVIQNGYTDLPPIADKSKLTPENVFPLIDEEGLAMRHDTLESKAYSYRYDNDFYGGSWVIMFRHKARPDIVKFYGEGLEHMGRAVVMNFFGKRVRIQHSEYPLTMPDAKIINP